MTSSLKVEFLWFCDFDWVNLELNYYFSSSASQWMNVKFLLFFTWDPENPRPRPKSIPLFTLNIWHITMRDHGTGLFSFTCVEICKSWHFGRLQDWCQVDLQLKNPIFSQLCTEIWLFCCLSCGYCHFTNSAGAMYCLIYIFFQILLLMFKFSKKYFSELCPILKKSVGLWWRWRWGWRWKIFHW